MEGTEVGRCLALVQFLRIFNSAPPQTIMIFLQLATVGPPVVVVVV